MVDKMKRIPEHGYCFVCGTENPKGIGIKWHINEKKEIYAEFVPGIEQQGPPKHMHGGASAAILDEAMGFAAWAKGHKIVSVNLNINYLKAVPLNQKIKVYGRIIKEEGNKFFAEGEIVLLNGEVAVKGNAILYEPEGFFDQIGGEFEELYKKNKDKFF